MLLCGVIACAALSTTRPARADYSSTVMGFNPVAYYRLNETASVPAMDRATNRGTTGAAGTGYYINSPLHEQPGALVASGDTAVAFDGTSAQQMQMPFNPALNPLGAFTVEAWVNPAVSPPPATQSALAAVLSYGHLGDPRSGWLIYQAAGGWNLRMYNHNGLNAALNITGGGAPVAGAWHHLVAVYDGTNGYVYVNGVLGAQGAATGYYPNVDGNFSVGTRSDSAFHYNGAVDEVALYTNALTATEIQAHYQNGVNPSPATPYSQLVLTQNPMCYFHMNEPTWIAPDPSTLPVATNNGSLGVAADGAYGPGMETGLPGVPYTGFTGNNYAPRFNAIAGSVAIPAQGIVTDTMTITCWLKREGNQSLGGLLFQRDASMASATGLQIWDSGGNNELRGNWSDGDWGISTGLTPPDGIWTFAAMVVTPTDTVIYMNDQSVSLAAKNGGALTHNPHDFSIGSLLIGQDPCCGARIFKGQIDEVAVFGTALTPAQINQLFASANVPPVILTQPAPNTSVNMGAPVNLSVVASGTPTLKYQWMKYGTNLTGKTTATLAFPSTTLADNGDYSVIITNDFGAVTSSVASVTIVPVPAAFLRAVGYPVYDPATKAGSLTQVILEFSAPLDASAITTPANYVITAGSTTLAVTGATFANQNQTVLLTTAPQTQAQLYTVTLNNIVDGTGLTISSPTNTAQFTSWVASPAGGVLCEVYYGGDDPATGNGNSNERVGAITSNPAYPDDPAFATNLYAFDSRLVYPDDTVENYGMRMSTVFTPAASGNWRFYLRSDDQSALYINPAGPSRSGRQLTINATSCCADWTSWQSGLIPMVAGQSYYLELLYKEGGGGDYGKVAAYLDGTTPVLGTANTAVDPASLNGPAVGFLYSPADVGGALSVVGPTNLTVPANHEASFYVSATGPEGQNLFYQWRRNGVAIDGATGTSYSLVAATTDNGAVFSVQVSKLGSVVTPGATLSVIADTDKPTVVAVRGTVALNTVLVRFSELVDVASAQDVNNYSIPGFTVTSAVLDSIGSTVTLTLNSELSPGQVTTLNVSGILDRGGNTMTAAAPPLRAFVLSRGLLQYDYFGEVPYLPADIYTVIYDPRFQDHPDWTTFITSFNSRLLFPDNTHDAYGSRISGVFVPPATGDYMLYLKSDDQSVLNFTSSGSDPLFKMQVAEAACCPGFADHPAGPYTLDFGQLYYIETVHKEGGGGDYVQVAGKLASDTTDPNTLFPLPAYMVGVLADPEGASVSITQQPASYTGVYRGATPPQALFAPNLATGNGDMTVVSYGPSVGSWSYNAAAGSWQSYGFDSCGGPSAFGLNTPPITIADGGGLTLSFTHRYSFEHGGTAWDGGQVRMSVNGGPFITIPSSAFTANGYVSPIEGSIVGAVSATPGWTNIAFVGESSGFATPTFLTSVASLGHFNAGDTAVLQFLQSWDDCSQGSSPTNWDITSVAVTSGTATPPTFSTWLTASATATYQNEPNAPVAYIWQQDTGAGFADLPGSGVPICPVNISLTDDVVRYRCIISGPGASVTSGVATATVTLPVSIAQTAPSTLTLRWPLPTPLPATSFVLEKSETLAAGSWSTVPTGTYQTDATSVFVPVTVSAADPPMFYRLRRQ